MERRSTVLKGSIREESPAKITIKIEFYCGNFLHGLQKYVDRDLDKLDFRPKPSCVEKIP